MKTSHWILLAVACTSLPMWGRAAPAMPQPGPEASGVRLRLVVSEREGFDVRLELVNEGKEQVTVKSNWAQEREGTFEEYLEEAASIESYPEIEPWLGQVRAGPARQSPEPTHALQPGEAVAVQWHTDGRRLKNKASNPLEVQNPEFTEDGLYSVHAGIVLEIGGQMMLLRSNEQLVAFGGSKTMPKQTYGRLWGAEEATKTATLGMGSLQKVAIGDRFLIHSGTIGMTWTLTINRIERDHAMGTLEPSRTNPQPAFPAYGWGATLLRRE